MRYEESKTLKSLSGSKTQSVKEQALRLKSKIEEQNSHVKKASRIVGVIEFEDGDPQGRAEYVGRS